MDKNKYLVDNIQVLRGLEPVKKRPGMFIGSTDVNGLHHLIWEIIDNSIDEAIGGHCSIVKVSLEEDSTISVEDDGRGIPIGIHKETGKSAVETIFTTLHAGGKFDSNSYKVSGGLHGVGASVVNALAKKLEVKVFRNGNIYKQTFIDGGMPVEPLKNIGKSNKTGTKISFLTDFSYFPNIDYDENIILKRLKELAYLNKGLRIIFVNKLTDSKKNFYFKNGIVEYIKEIILENQKVVDKILYFEGEFEKIQVEIALTYINTNKENILSFCNNINTIHGGTHIEGFKSSLTRSITRYGKDKKLFPSKIQIISDDCREGVVAIVSVKHQDPQFEGQTKTRLGNLNAKSATSKLTYKFLHRYFDENPKVIQTIIKYIINSANARIAAKKARENVKKKITHSSLTLPGKLADCSSKNIYERELFIVEGDSAGGSAKLARNRVTQAILPLKGKIINTQKENIIRVLANEEIRSIEKALGTGLKKNDEDNFNYDKRRYERIVIMTDADVDGSHIGILLLTFFINLMPELIINKNIYLAQPPLYKVVFTNNKFVYLYDLEEYEIFKKENNRKIKLTQRYKGLGEMNPEQLWETTMDPKNRKLLQINISDMAFSKELFEKLMGAKGISYRKEFILENYNNARNLDV